jgi:hypothetical protein
LLLRLDRFDSRFSLYVSQESCTLARTIGVLDHVDLESHQSEQSSRISASSLARKHSDEVYFPVLAQQERNVR